jgi:energy-coupling factor transporter ATP-binding protein EcfA2
MPPSKTTQAGQHHRNTVARRSREMSRSVREIAPLPAMKNPQRRIKARKDLRYFCTEYFATKFKLTFSSYHETVIKTIQKELIEGKEKVCLAMPRGSGKTTLVQAAVIWAILYGHCRFILVIGANKSEAKKLIENIKTDLIGNKKLLEDFPEAIYPLRKLGGQALQARGQLYLGELTNPQWKPDMVVFPTILGSLSSGAAIVTAGIGSGIRGKNRTMPDGSIARPNMVVLDDIQTDADARSPKRIEKLEGIINGTVAGLVGPGQSMGTIMTCTVIQPDDLSDRYLNAKLYIQWKGMRFKMVEQMPDRMDLWDEYWEVCKTKDYVAAKMFYKRNRPEMDRGAVVAWKENYEEGKQLSALQYAMDKYYSNIESFMSEYQNDPMRPDQGAMVVPAKVIRTRLNGLDHQTLPLDAQTLTGFIDVHDDLLYYTVVAWSDDFTGYIIDYGTYPKQKRRQFSKGESGLNTMSRSDQRADGVIQQGLVSLVKELMSTHWYVEGDRDHAEPVAFSKLLIDTGYKSQIVENAIRLAVGNTKVVMPARGKSVRAVQQSMSEWKRKAGATHGNHWIETTPVGRARTLTVDTNFWKCQVHDAFRLLPGNLGSLTLWGRDSEAHRMFSEHMNSEVAKLVESGGNTVYEWQNTPNDNHFFDCIVGCMVAASRSGITSAEQRAVKTKRNISPV